MESDSPNVGSVYKPAIDSSYQEALSFPSAVSMSPFPSLWQRTATSEQQLPTLKISSFAHNFDRAVRQPHYFFL